MIDTELLTEKLKKGAFVGVGSFASSYVGSQIADRTGLTELQISGAKVALGAGAAYVSADDDILEVSGMVRQAGEFAGYGMQGAGWAEIGQNFNAGVGGGRGRRASKRASSRRVETRTVQTDGGSGSGNSGRNGSGNVGADAEFMIDA